MILDRLKIRNFQSLGSLDIELKPLTVIVGSSNSGKSALGRALRVLARNQFSSGYVTHGQKSASITAFSGDASVSVERGPSLSSFVYSHDGVDDRFAKTGTTVPDEVLAWLRTPEDDQELHFTTQFDAPFLLASSGSQVSRVLGSLTNVTMLSEAAREANKRRQAASATAVTREEDAARLASEARSRFGDLSERRVSVQQAREAYSELSADASLLQRTSDLLESLVSVDAALESLSSELEASSESLDEVASFVSKWTAAATKVTELAGLVSQVQQTSLALASLEKTVAINVDALAAAVDEKEQALREAGVCPLCGSDVSEVSHAG